MLLLQYLIKPMTCLETTLRIHGVLAAKGKSGNILHNVKLLFVRKENVNKLII